MGLFPSLHGSWLARAHQHLKQRFSGIQMRRSYKWRRVKLAGSDILWSPCKCLGDAAIPTLGQYQPGFLRGTSSKVSPSQTALTFLTHHQVMMGGQAGALLRQNTEAHMASPLAAEQIDSRPDPAFWRRFPLPLLSSPPSLPDSLGTVKSSELSGGMSDDCVELSAEHTHNTNPHTMPPPHTHTRLTFLIPSYFQEADRCMNCGLRHSARFIIKSHLLK